MPEDVYKRMVALIDEAAHGGKTRWQVFSDFLTVNAISYANSSSPTKDDTWQARENEFHKIWRSYQQPVILAELAGGLIEAFQRDYPNYTDVLGTLFESLYIQDKWHGQFFTPQPLCEVTAMTFNVEAAKETILKRGYIKIHEPASGGGAMLLAIINRLISAGINPSTQTLFVANDLDIRSVYMSYIQLSLAGVPAIVNHMDTLTLREISPPWYTPVFHLDGWAQRLDLERRVDAMRAILSNNPKPRSHFTKPKPARPTEPKYEQLTLF